MKRQSILLASAILLALPTAFAQDNTKVPASWVNQKLATATYVILDPQLSGNPSLLGGDKEQKSVLAAMVHDAAGAIKRRYNLAQFSTDRNNPNFIKVTPIVITPKYIAPWNKMTGRLSFILPDGQAMNLENTFSLVELWPHQAEVLNYLYDQVVQKMP